MQASAHFEEQRALFSTPPGQIINPQNVDINNALFEKRCDMSNQKDAVRDISSSYNVNYIQSSSSPLSHKTETINTFFIESAEFDNTIEEDLSSEHLHTNNNLFFEQIDMEDLVDSMVFNNFYSSPIVEGTPKKNIIRKNSIDSENSELTLITDSADEDIFYQPAPVRQTKCFKSDLRTNQVFHVDGTQSVTRTDFDSFWNRERLEKPNVKKRKISMTNHIDDSSSSSSSNLFILQSPIKFSS
ncbi:hypothetical protein QEN19_003312 [Hanseniaspora menglaensis]